MPTDYSDLADRRVHWTDDDGRTRTVYQSTYKTYIVPDLEFADVCADIDEAAIARISSQENTNHV